MWQTQVAGLILMADGFGNVLVHWRLKYENCRDRYAKLFQVGRFLRGIIGIVLLMV